MKYSEDLHKWYHTIHVNKDWASIPIIINIERNLGLTFNPTANDHTLSNTGDVCMAGSPEVRDEYKETFTQTDLLNYIFAVLHSHSFRKKYMESMDVDFSRVPYPSPPKLSPDGRKQAVSHFWKLVRLGGQLRQLPKLETKRLIQEIDTIELG